MEESDLHNKIIPFHSPPIRPPHLIPRSIRPLSYIFGKPISYLSYGLNQRIDTRSSAEATKTRIRANNLNPTMNCHTFNGTDPIRVFKFLNRFWDELITLYMS